MKNKIILKGNDILRWIFISVSLILLIISLLNIKDLKILVIIPIIISLCVLFLIQFPKLTIDENGVVFEKKGLIRILDLKERYNFNEIDSYDYKKGDGTISLINKLLIYRNAGFGPRTKPDRMILNLKNGKIKIIQKINSKERFNEFIDKFDKRLKMYST